MSEHDELSMASVKEALPNEDDEPTQSKEDSWKRASMRSSLKAPIDMKYALPPTPAELVEDPRTGLSLIEVPQEYLNELNAVFKQGMPLLHYVEKLDKLNHKGKYDKRFLVITNHCVVLLQQDASIARMVPIDQIMSLTYFGDDMVSIHAPDVDIVVKAPEQAKTIVRIISNIFEFKRCTPMVTDTVYSEQEIKETSVLKKPAGWKAPDNVYLHTKADLHRQLSMLNKKVDITVNDDIDVDPRTQLALIKIPDSVGTVFKGTPFDPNSPDPAILHFFCPCLKVNHKAKLDPRYCFTSNSCVYLTYTTGAMQRSLFITLITKIYVSGDTVGLVVPSEFDLMMKFGTKEWGPEQTKKKIDEFVNTIRTQWEFRNGKQLTVEETEEVPQLQLNKPSRWNPKITPTMTKSALMAHLAALGATGPNTESTESFFPL